MQLQGGLSKAELLAGTDTRIRLLGEGKRRQLHLRIGSNGRAPVWAVFPIFYHREIPDDAVIKWVKVCIRRVAAQLDYSVHFPLETARGSLPPPTEGTVAIDVGWRQFPDGVRVAMWLDDTGRAGELRLPQQLIERWKKTHDLQSIRDRIFNDALAELLRARREGGVTAWPDWLCERTAHAFTWESPRRLGGLLHHWRHNRFPEDGPLYERLEGWRKQDRHLWEWQANQRENVLRARREAYRLFARQMAKYKRVAVECLDLRDFAELPEKGAPPEDPRTTAARPRRFAAALSTLLDALAFAAARAGCEWRELPPEHTTQTCAQCHKREPFDAAGNVEHRCSHCGALWDQDRNAALNLLRTAQCDDGPFSRSRIQKYMKTGESITAKRRREGKEAKAAKRSKKSGQDGGNSED